MSRVTAIFYRDFNYTSRVRNAGWSIKASPEPQSFPKEVIDAAVAAGVARRVKRARKSKGSAVAQP